MSPQHAHNCERWFADQALMQWLKDTAQAALEQMGNTLDTPTMIRNQGVYKAVSELIKQIEGGAKAAPSMQRSHPTFNFPPN